MDKTSIIQTVSVAAILGLAAIQTQAQSTTFTFADNTSDGWTAGGFGAGAPLAVSAIGGNNYVFAEIYCKLQ